jgi:mono/diheme cytochrome c family protein
MRSSNRGSFLAAIVAAALSVPVPAPGAEKGPDAAAAKKGEITYVRYCVSCHGKAAKGDGPLAGDLRVAVPDLTTLSARSGGRYPYDRVVRIIESGELVRGHGSEDMPAWGDAFKRTRGTEEATIAAAIRNLTHYLWSRQAPAPAKQ